MVFFNSIHGRERYQELKRLGETLGDQMTNAPPFRCEHGGPTKSRPEKVSRCLKSECLTMGLAFDVWSGCIFLNCNSFGDRSGAFIVERCSYHLAFNKSAWGVPLGCKIIPAVILSAPIHILVDLIHDDVQYGCARASWNLIATSWSVFKTRKRFKYVQIIVLACYIIVMIKW